MVATAVSGLQSTAKLVTAAPRKIESWYARLLGGTYFNLLFLDPALNLDNVLENAHQEHAHTYCFAV